MVVRWWWGGWVQKLCWVVVSYVRGCSHITSSRTWGGGEVVVGCKICVGLLLVTVVCYVIRAHADIDLIMS